MKRSAFLFIINGKSIDLILPIFPFIFFFYILFVISQFIFKRKTVIKYYYYYYYYYYWTALKKKKQKQKKKKKTSSEVNLFFQSLMLPLFFNGLLSYLVGMKRKTSRRVACKRDNFHFLHYVLISPDVRGLLFG